MTLSSKRALRARLRAARAGLSEAYRRTASAQLCRHIARSDVFERAHTVALYLSVPSEVDLGQLAKLAHAARKTVALPRLTGPGEMHFSRWLPEATLVPNHYGILEPGEDAATLAASALDLVVVPGVGFDAQGGRLGMGQGYYDRALADTDHPIRIGAAFDVQLVETVPTEPHDLSMHAVATETGLLWVTR